MAQPLAHRVENWGSASTWCCLAEAAALVGDVSLARQMADLLAPLSGRVAVSGISSVMGPEDGYLALALAACGRHEQATAAADRGIQQAQAWGFTEYDAWLRAWREKLSI
jgi:ABC-type amino acid transport substrate-binding protein